ncbi:MAG: hypothetical protein JJE17_10585 [Peptostreptococcaceae bacterium]|nr:hypothetical protein [Peptostreptococcaceae bacterium]
MERYVIKEASLYKLKKERDQFFKKGWKMQKAIKPILQGNKFYYCQTMVRANNKIFEELNNAQRKI